jgi:uncharacterized protein involved in exopolysaccharide biosynthesis
VDTARAELDSAETKVLEFLESNREFRDAPQLVARYDHLQRDVTIKQEVLLTLSRSFEEARIQEVNDAPVITVIDQAIRPVQPSRPLRRLIVVTTMLLSAFLALVVAIIHEFVGRIRDFHPQDYDEYRQRTEGMRKAVRSVVRPRLQSRTGPEV